MEARGMTAHLTPGVLLAQEGVVEQGATCLARLVAPAMQAVLVQRGLPELGQRLVTPATPVTPGLLPLILGLAEPEARGTPATRAQPARLVRLATPALPVTQVIHPLLVLLRLQQAHCPVARAATQAWADPVARAAMVVRRVTPAT